MSEAHVYSVPLLCDDDATGRKFGKKKRGRKKRADMAEDPSRKDSTYKILSIWISSCLMMIKSRDLT